MGRIVVGYVRVSTAEQADEGDSLRAQHARLGAWCAANSDRVAAYQGFEDAGLSGSRADNRPGLARALGAACVPGGVLLVYSLSRLARSVKDTLAIAERLEAAGADLVSLSESIDTTSAAGKMVFRLLAVLAEFERDLAVERTRAILADKRGRGERTGQVPYGKRLSPDGVTLREDDDERRTLALIRALRAWGRSGRAIAAELDRLGIPSKNAGPTRSGRPHKTASGRWSESTIRRILKKGSDDGSKSDEAEGPDPHRAAPHGDGR